MELESAENEFKKVVRRNLDQILLSKCTSETIYPQLYESILNIQNQRLNRSRTFK